MRLVLKSIAVLAIAGVAVFWWVTRPITSDASILAGLEPDLAQGALVFHAGGCASCHAAEGAEGDARLEMAGGRSFPSDFGTFYAPNISPDPDYGIGRWSGIDFYNALHHGVSPEGQHYYPAFPYTSYVRATPEDIVSLHAFMMTLPATDAPNRRHDIGFPFSIRRNLGAWKWLFHDPEWVLDGDLSEEERRGRYLAEALGHCGECHTSRNALGGLDYARWMAGAPNPTGSGNIPNVTPAKFDWSVSDTVEYFTSGFTPEYDTAGGHMVDVIENLSQLSVDDRHAIALYLKRILPVE
ncbi:cytochrome c [uncultured Tateyamaria sp.]|uniref:c-type cytochrome n=1 Tax=uncultured Tateyamaria sp. TaxID=455651 RepID=UPI002637253C|nr:cytochrome c [uncultured Tateyamaria sp.]